MAKFPALSSEQLYPATKRQLSFLRLVSRKSAVWLDYTRPVTQLTRGNNLSNYQPRVHLLCSKLY